MMMLARVDRKIKGEGIFSRFPPPIHSLTMCLVSHLLLMESRTVWVRFDRWSTLVCSFSSPIASFAASISAKMRLTSSLCSAEAASDRKGHRLGTMSGGGGDEGGGRGAGGDYSIAKEIASNQSTMVDAFVIPYRGHIRPAPRQQE